MASSVLRASTIVLAVAAIAACGKGPQQAQQTPPPPEVGVITAHAQGVPLTRELVGRLYPTRIADVRARVAGVLQKRVYAEGTDVKEGQLLFQIDPAPLQAALNAQLANLASAQATYTNAHVAAERAHAVVSKGLMSKTDWDNAEAAERTAAASVKQAQANVDLARINLGYATVTAPIGGRASQQQVTEGALVGQGDATLLTTVEQIDPIYVYFSQPVADMDGMGRAAATGGAELFAQNKATVELLRPDGSPYGATGTLDFSDAAVNAPTGSVELRAIVPNPEHRLLPGMYVNLRVTLGELKNAFLIASPAVLRDAGGAYVYCVAADGKVTQKRIKTETLRGDSWVVSDGLSDGDQVVASGVQTAGSLMQRSKDPRAKAVPWKPAGSGAEGASTAAAQTAH